MIVRWSAMTRHHDRLIEVPIKAGPLLTWQTVPLITPRFPLNTVPVGVPNDCDWNIIGIH